MSMQRHVPIITDHSRMYPADMDHFFRDSSFSNFRDVLPRDPTRDHYREVVREPAVYHHPSTSVMPLSRSFFNPERQLGTMDMDMQRMASEMRRMYQDMQHLMPVDANPDSWRKKENYLLDNPVYHDQSLGRELFRLQFDVRQFKPEGNLGENGWKDMNPENLVSKLSRDGVLTIEAPLPVTDGNRLIAIKHE